MYACACIISADLDDCTVQVGPGTCILRLWLNRKFLTALTWTETPSTNALLGHILLPSFERHSFGTYIRNLGLSVRYVRASLNHQHLLSRLRRHSAIYVFGFPSIRAWNRPSVWDHPRVDHTFRVSNCCNYQILHFHWHMVLPRREIWPSALFLFVLIFFASQNSV